MEGAEEFRNSKLEDMFSDLVVIGKGSFATVLKGTCKSKSMELQDKTLAIKCVNTQRLGNTKLEWNLYAEVKVLKEIRHPNIIEMFQIKRIDQCVYLIMEYCELGDLSQYLTRKGGRLSEPLARNLISQLARGLSFLHEKRLIHRDIKPQNLLLQRGNLIEEEIVLKIGDFGFVKNLNNFGDLAETLCGSPLYMAPEILRYEKYDGKVDLWSVGIITFQLIFGQVPFKANNHIQLLQRIESSSNTIDFPSNAACSQDCKSFIQALLQRDPKRRIGYKLFRIHPFLVPHPDDRYYPMKCMVKSEPDYIVVDKENVEMNSFADDLTNETLASKESSNNPVTIYLNECFERGKLIMDLALEKGQVALSLYIISLQIFQKSINYARQFWENQRGKSIDQIADLVQFNELVQGIRNQYNFTLKKAQEFKEKEGTEENTVEAVQKEIFERALMFSRQGASLEFKGEFETANSQYQRSSSLLLVLLDPDLNIQKITLNDEDYRILQCFLQSIQERQISIASRIKQGTS